MKCSILLIDDNSIDNFISEHVLMDINPSPEIIVKNSAIDALEYLRSGHAVPDFIFLDINMPRMDGFSFLNELESFPDPAIKKCSVAMLTSSYYPDDKDKAMRSPFVKYFFNKPLTNEILREMDIPDGKCP